MSTISVPNMNFKLHRMIDLHSFFVFELRFIYLRLQQGMNDCSWIFTISTDFSQFPSQNGGWYGNFEFRSTFQVSHVHSKHQELWESRFLWESGQFIASYNRDSAHQPRTDLSKSVRTLLGRIMWRFAPSEIFTLIKEKNTDSRRTLSTTYSSQRCKNIMREFMGSWNWNSGSANPRVNRLGAFQYYVISNSRIFDLPI